MQTWVIPVVPEGPETPKLNSFVVESKVRLVRVEFEVTEKTFRFWLLKGTTAKLYTAFTPEYSPLPGHAASIA